MGKRKRGPVVLDEEDQNGTTTIGVGETLSALRNASADAVEERERSSKKRKKVATIDGKKVKYPQLHFAGGRLQSSVKIADLQSLLLYCFSDGVAPTWISVKNSGHVRKAVVLMVPGLERGMFEKKKKDGCAEDADADEKTKMTGFERWLRGISPVPSSSFNPVPLDEEVLPEPLKPLAEMFSDVWPVKSPGDTKYNKVHSPLQAILLSALPKGKSDGKGAKPVWGTTFSSQRTPITTFLLSLQDMKENEYVRHPAVFDVQEEKAADAELRRVAGQGPDDGWVDTNVGNYAEGTPPEKDIQQGSMTAGREVLSLDCEMCVTEGGKYSLTRISLISWDGEVVLDELVKPEKPIIDYLTQYSGITKEQLDPVTTTLSDIQTKLLSILHPRTILVGHSLNADLTALQLTHPFIVDTAIAYPHPRGPPLKSSLKWLAQKYLGKEIQKGSNGHDSVEDARTALGLIKLKCEKGERWGTSGQSSESIFTRLGRTKKHVRPEPEQVENATAPGRTGALVDWGSPERGFGAQATVALGCKNDEDVVANVNRAVNGDPSNSDSPIPAGGVDFTWARLRELEIAKGWCNRKPPSTETSTATATATATEPGKESEAEPPNENENENEKESESLFSTTLTQTIAHIHSIYTSLPPCTLFIVYSGTGDPRAVTRLQAMHRTYMSEFRARVPWDQLSVKWTDVEEQALKKAVGRAREGCAFVTVR